MNTELADRYWEIRFVARSRAIYYSRRQLFWTGLEMFAQLGEFVLSTAAFIALTRDHATFGMWTAFATSIISFLALWFSAGKRARKCAMMSRDYDLLVADVPPYYEIQTSEGAEKAKERLDALRASEGTGLDCLGVACYIDACFEYGAKPQWRMSWVERTFGRWLPIRYTPKPETAHSAG
ncbi:MAG: hypothetical protein IKQ17_05465 [Kiritimatiellae bacterium]|nr:hypothetical protein [Kiritimatiellia bacterium]